MEEVGGWSRWDSESGGSIRSSVRNGSRVLANGRRVGDGEYGGWSSSPHDDKGLSSAAHGEDGLGGWGLAPVHARMAPGTAASVSPIHGAAPFVLSADSEGEEEVSDPTLPFRKDYFAHQGRIRFTCASELNFHLGAHARLRHNKGQVLSSAELAGSFRVGNSQP